MTELTINELKERLAHQLDEVTLLDLLGLDIHDLVDILEDHIIENYDKLSDYLYD